MQFSVQLEECIGGGIGVCNTLVHLQDGEDTAVELISQTA